MEVLRPQVRVQVEDVNEAPRFPPEDYEASVLSIAPFKTPVVQVKAWDPDVGEGGRLVYRLTADSPHFDVDPSSGRLYVVSALGLEGQVVTVEITARDPRGLHGMTTVKVTVQGGASGVDVVFISINRPANVVENKVPELERSLGAVLGGWTVNVIEVSNAAAPRAAAAPKTRVGFIAEDGGLVVPSGEVTAKLQSQSDAVRAELVKVFGEGLHFDVALEPQSPASSQAAVIALATMLALCMLGLMAAVGVIVRFKRQQKPQDSDKESFNIDQGGHRNWSEEPHDTSEQADGGVAKLEPPADSDSDSDTSPL
ncbi:Cadherin-23 [Liparis tanakae]|uniref:Cadherin-23 n=1 Tax=Liparis tanakae TaxID=230148 RepID=A0A4Z2H4R3_9TELE|nr:Cadherin-23 [Liparis tanakae]